MRCAALLQRREFQVAVPDFGALGLDEQFAAGDGEAPGAVHELAVDAVLERVAPREDVAFRPLAQGGFDVLSPSSSV